MKICSKCKIEKNIFEFNKNKSQKDGFANVCKICCKEINSVYYNKNKDKFVKYAIDNKDKIKSRIKVWRFENQERLSEYSKQYKKQNKEYCSKYHTQYYKKRRSEDSLFKFKSNIRNLISMSIKKQGFSKKSKTYEYLCCNIDEFKVHIEKQFTEGMNWNNQGEWHLDHIKPISLANTEQEVIELNHYTNFQPLWAKDNIKKSNKYERT
jgi:hypothetical protein